MMSRTDKDRPCLVQESDPLNRRFLKVGHHMKNGGHDGDEYFWKKMWPATRCWCCSSRHWRGEKRKRRSSWKGDIDMTDL